jgi:hypothetical protein
MLVASKCFRSALWGHKNLPKEAEFTFYLSVLVWRRATAAQKKRMIDLTIDTIGRNIAAIPDVDFRAVLEIMSENMLMVYGKDTPDPPLFSDVPVPWQTFEPENRFTSVYHTDGPPGSIVLAIRHWSESHTAKFFFQLAESGITKELFGVPGLLDIIVAYYGLQEFCP